MALPAQVGYIVPQEREKYHVGSSDNMNTSYNQTTQ